MFTITSTCSQVFWLLITIHILFRATLISSADGGISDEIIPHTSDFTDLKSFMLQFLKEQNEMRQLKLTTLKDVRSDEVLKLDKGIDIKPSDYTTADVFIPMCINYLLDEKVTSDNLISIIEVASFFDYFCDELNIDQCEGNKIEYYQLSVDMQLIFIYAICEKESYQTISNPVYQSCIETLRHQVKNKYAYGLESTPTTFLAVASKVEDYCATAYQTTIYYHRTIQPSVAPSPMPSPTASSPSPPSSVPTNPSEKKVPTAAPVNLHSLRPSRRLSTDEPTPYLSYVSNSPSSNSTRNPSNGNTSAPSVPSLSPPDRPTISPSGEPSFLSQSPSSNSNGNPTDANNSEPSASPSVETRTYIPSTKPSYLSPSPSSISGKTPTNGSSQPSSTSSTSLPSLTPTSAMNLKPSQRPLTLKPTSEISTSLSPSFTTDVYPSNSPAPSVNLSTAPTTLSSVEPTFVSSGDPTFVSSGEPTFVSSSPSSVRSLRPSLRPSAKRTSTPSTNQSSRPSHESTKPPISPIPIPSMSPSTKLSAGSSNSPSNFRTQPPHSNQPSSKQIVNPTGLPSSVVTTAPSSEDKVLRDRVLSFTYMLGYIDPKESQSFYEGDRPSTLDSLTYAIIMTLLQPTAISSIYLSYGISEVDHKTIIRSSCTPDFVESTDCILVVSEIRFPHEEGSKEDINNNVLITIRSSMDDSSFRDRVAKEEVKEIKYVQDGGEPQLPEPQTRGIGGGVYAGIGVGAAVVLCAPFVAMFARSSRNRENNEEDDDSEEDLISIDPLVEDSE